jgi:hypothetical protein
MNERIRQIAEQVYGSAATEQEIKFAEAIVRECANFISKRASIGQSLLGELLKEHFEVK